MDIFFFEAKTIRADGFVPVAFHREPFENIRSGGEHFVRKTSGKRRHPAEPEDPEYSGKIEMENLDFQALTKLYFNKGSSQGSLSGTYEFTGRGGDARTLEGRGNLNLVKGDLFAVPVFAPLSGILNGIVPGMGSNPAHQASTSFTVGGGAVSTDDLSVNGQGFDMTGRGKIYFLDDKLDFKVHVDATGLPAAGKKFEYSGGGPLFKPSWKPAN